MVLASNLENMGILDAGVVALLGYAVVFFGLILLMCVVTVMGKIFIAKDKKVAAHSAAAKAAAEGAENSKNFASKFGRAKSYGTKTIGTPDAGAMSMACFFRGLAQA